MFQDYFLLLLKSFLLISTFMVEEVEVQIFCPKRATSDINFQNAAAV